MGGWEARPNRFECGLKRGWARTLHKGAWTPNCHLYSASAPHHMPTPRPSEDGGWASRPPCIECVEGESPIPPPPPSPTLPSTCQHPHPNSVTPRHTHLYISSSKGASSSRLARSKWSIVLTSLRYFWAV
jgi:hypothetical protein